MAMFAKGKHLIQPWTSRSQCLYHLAKAGLEQQSHQTLYSCHRNSIFNHLLNPWRNKGGRHECQLNFARQMFFAVYQESHHLHHKRSVYYIQHNNLYKPVGIMVFLRSLSSEPDSGGKPLTQIDVNVQDTAEDVDKELDAVVAGQRISWKGKNSSVNGLKVYPAEISVLSSGGWAWNLIYCWRVGRLWKCSKFCVWIGNFPPPN